MLGLLFLLPEIFRQSNPQSCLPFHQGESDEACALTGARHAVAGFQLVQGAMHVALKVGFVVAEKTAIIEIERDGQVLAKVLVRVVLSVFLDDEASKNLPAHFELERLSRKLFEGFLGDLHYGRSGTRANQWIFTLPRKPSW